MPVLTDVHLPEQCAPRGRGRRRACRSRRSCAGRPTCWSPPAGPARAINVKKGQFLAPVGHEERRRQDQRQPATTAILMCERGVSFGYNRWCRHAGRCRSLGARPAARSCSTRRTRCSSPAGKGDRAAASARFVRDLARAAVACGSRPCSWKRTRTPIEPQRRPEHDPDEAIACRRRDAAGARPLRQGAPRRGVSTLSEGNTSSRLRSILLNARYADTRAFFLFCIWRVEETVPDTRWMGEGHA